MANTHSLFSEFNSLIRLTEPRRQTLLYARDDLRTRLRNAFILLQGNIPIAHDLEFQSQGSVVMDTIINPISEDYDLDDGVYFIGNLLRDKRPTPTQFHNFVNKSITKDNPYINKVIDKETCVRVIYNEGFEFVFEQKNDKLKKGFHIDLPIYYAGTKKSPDLAHIKQSWLTSDPIEFIAWFEEKVKSRFDARFLYERKQYSREYDNWRDQMRKEDAQLRRIVRYLKAWCEIQGNDMPCGIVLTIWAANNYVADERDDLSFKNTIININKQLEKKFECIRPTVPKGEDLLDGYKHAVFFKQRLETFANVATQAINESNQKIACAKWQSQFGNRFSCINALDKDENAKSFQGPAIIVGNAKSSKWFK
jgi:hypothetical protein